MGSALFGSVGLHCILHAPCPVTVVRPAMVVESVLDNAIEATTTVQA
jgi:hypothetical protein